MKKLRDLRLQFLLSAALFLIIGCAISKPTHHPGLVTSWNRQNPFPPIDPPSIAVELHTQRTLYDDRPSPSWLLTRLTQRAVKRAQNTVIREFPVLTRANLGSAEEAYRLVIEATHARRGSEARAWLSALSLGIIPSTVELALELEAHLYRDQTLVRVYQATGSHQLRINTLSLLLGGQRMSVPRHTIENTFRDLFLQIQQDTEELFRPEKTPSG